MRSTDLTDCLFPVRDPQTVGRDAETTAAMAWSETSQRRTLESSRRRSNDRRRLPSRAAEGREQSQSLGAASGVGLGDRRCSFVLSAAKLICAEQGGKGKCGGGGESDSEKVKVTIVRSSEAGRYPLRHQVRKLTSYRPHRASRGRTRAQTGPAFGLGGVPYTSILILSAYDIITSTRAWPPAWRWKFISKM